MSTISHRDLRNSSGEILRAAAAGESFVITNHGTAVARIVPVESPDAELRCARPARESGGFIELHRRHLNERVIEVIDDLRGER